MVINNNLMAMNANRNLGINSGGQSGAMEKLSSGLRINGAGDDAAGLAISEKMRNQIKGLQQASRNAQDGISLIQTAEGALGESQEMLKRVRELSIQAMNDTYTPEDRQKINDEVSQLVSEIDGISEKTEFNDQPLLRGNVGGENEEFFKQLEHKTTVAKSAYDKKEAEVNVALNSYNIATGSLKIAKSDLKQASIAKQNASVDKITISRHRYSLEGQLSVAKGQYTQRQTDEATYRTSLSDLKTSIEEAHTSLQEAKASLEKLKTSQMAATPTNPNVGDLITKAEDNIKRLEIGLETKLVRVSTLENFIIETNRFKSTAIKLSDHISVVERVSLKIGSIYIKAGSNVDKAYDRMSTASANLKTTSSNLKIVSAPLAGLKDAYNNAQTQESIELENAGGVDFDFHVGANEDQKVAVTIDAMNARALGVHRINTLTVSAASDTLAKIDAAIEKVSVQRANLGSVQNRLEHTIKNVDNTAENLTTAESGIRDTDMAAEMMTLTKFNILAQASQSMLAQANQAPQQVLQLLG